MYNAIIFIRSFLMNYDFQVLSQLLVFLEAGCFSIYEPKQLRKKCNIFGFDVMNYCVLFIENFGTFCAFQTEDLIRCFWPKEKRSYKTCMSFGDIIIHRKKREQSIFDLTYSEIQNANYSFSFFKTRLDDKCFFTLGTKFFQMSFLSVVACIRNAKDKAKAFKTDEDLFVIPTFISLWGLFTVSRELKATDRYDDYAVFANYLISDQLEKIWRANSNSDSDVDSNCVLFRLIGILEGIKLFETYKKAYLEAECSTDNKPELKMDTMISLIRKVFSNTIPVSEFCRRYSPKDLSLVDILEEYASIDP